MLDTIINLIINKRKGIEKIFYIVILISVICVPFVGVNYDLSEYLPDYAPSKHGLSIMEEEFGYPGTARIMIGDVSIYEAKLYKDQIEAVDGVDMVIWADSKTDIYQSNLFINYENIDDYYKDNYAVMDVTFNEGDSSPKTHKAIKQIQKITKDKGYFTGSAVQNKSLSETLIKEISIAMVMGVFMIWLILTITTTSWFEPILFLLIMGIAIVINMGTNIFLGTISFLTFSVAAILQLAIAMDYSIFLLHTFTREKNKGLEPIPAIRNAIKEAVSSILSSGATTIVGFIVLALMEFTIGRDMGIVLAKGIVISLFTVLFLMPAFILRWSEKIEKTAHRSFMPSFTPLAHFIYKIRYGFLIIMLLLAVPAYTAQNMNNFLYGNDALGGSEGTAVYDDEQEINSRFGRSNLILLLVPNYSSVKEKQLSDEIEDLYYTKSVTSLAGSVPDGVPESFLPKSITSNLHTDDYSRILIYIKTANESNFAFKCTNEIQSIMKKYYPEDSHIVGVTPSTMDIKDIITDDYARVNVISLIGVAIVVMLTFKSLIVPIVVMIPIEIATFINMAMPYIVGDQMIFMGYIIVSCLQLGATIDYSILVTNNYLNSRSEFDRKTSAVKTVEMSALSVITSGSILTIVGYGLYFTSSVSAIADIGRLVGRGALFSVILVLCMLPALLMMSDRMIFNQKRRLDKLIEKRRKARLQLKEHINQKLKLTSNKITVKSSKEQERGINQ